MSQDATLQNPGSLLHRVVNPKQTLITIKIEYNFLFLSSWIVKKIPLTD